ncbi:flagellar basal body-associated FliL family protein [Roseospira marina]|uniref:Flagellar basal body-associated FliL family protein n=1 Tax=Roseospira marina TaxID=140057 RepID=A0A5M6I8J9_9PROT|nr:flagellar basal body-associated FliL family protein [Roseospira marina]KAA5604135.1 flagellar basal body-associated FliL family protein [Roseospira marina]MBB4315769.1 flagellar basal body-associated protein FliL [Roseospira marina]MBB5088936.1 flagellar basal body-associated protein FliL [Roseospira marina]
MVKLLLIVVLAIVVLGGATVGLTLGGIIPDVLGVGPILGMAPPADEPAEAEAEAHAEPPASDYGPSPTFLRMPQFAVPLIVDGQVNRHLNLSLRLHINPEKEAAVTQAMPRLNDAFLTGLIQKLPELRDRAGRLDGPGLKAVLNALARREMEGDSIYDVLIDNAYFR